MLVELANVSDAQKILYLQILAYQSEAAIYNDYSIPPLIQTMDEMETDLRQQVVFKVTIDDRLVGSVRGFLQDGTCHIGRLIVHPEFQNRGIGTTLMSSIEQHFSEVNRFELFTGNRSERNLYLYQKLGYRIIRTDHLNDKVTVVFLEKDGHIFENKNHS
jgi:ribosomal protein S18 acetylase RimI-like enzyme